MNAITVQDQIKGTLTAMAPQFKAALPPHINVEKFIRVAQTAILTNPAIAKLDKNSLYKSCIEAAQDGLLPDGKESAIVPFGNNATYMPMIAGVLKKVRNSGEISTINAQAVHEHDEFDYYIDGEGEHLTHRPEFKGARGPEILTYAIAKLKDGSVYVEIITVEQMNEIKKCSRGNGGPWKTFPGEMKRKSAIRRLAKRLPTSTDLEKTLERDNQFYDFEKKTVHVKNQIDDTPEQNLMSDMGINVDDNTKEEVIETTGEVL